MDTLRARWATFLDQQHCSPSGLAGRVVGEKMVWQHAPETQWTFDLLDIQPHDRVLELGCGAGRGLALAARQAHYGAVVGLDLSTTMLQASYQRNRAALRAGRIALLRGNIQSLPFRDQQFDKIASVHTLYFWPDPLLIFAELVRILRPGGKIAITVATGQKDRNGAWHYGPFHQEVEALAQQLQRLPVASVELKRGPNSRQYNNLALLVQ